MNIRALVLLLFVFILRESLLFAVSKEEGWKAGVAAVKITPTESMWMAGYAARNHPSEGVLHDLWAKALVLEDSNGKKCALITTDLIGFPQDMSNQIRNRITSEYGLSRAQVILNSSHTHSGPVLMDGLLDLYPLDQSQIIKIRRYSDDLVDKIVNLTGEALRTMAPAHLESKNGVVRFQVNRRNNVEAMLHKSTDLNGPNDYAVPVIKVSGMSGNIMAIVFGYACHNTVLNNYEFSGDYAGYAQIELEKMYPDAVAMFFMGAGADQNPLPRRTVLLAQQYGRELAAAVDRTLNEEMMELEPLFNAAYEEIDLELSEPPDRDSLQNVAKSSINYQSRWAVNMLARLDKNEPFIASYPYPLQAWKLGKQLLIAMGGETVIEYAIELKKLYGHEIFVMGYANDVMAYIPSETVLEEGGYEGETSQIAFGLPSKWKSGIQERIMTAIVKVAEKAGARKVAQ